MAKPPRPPPAPERPGDHFRREIEAAKAEGVAPDDMTLRLTLGDVHKIKRDRGIAVDDISFAGGVMRYLGVKIEQGGVDASALDIRAET